MQEFWIVNAQSRCIEAYRKPEMGRYDHVQIIKPGEIADCTGLPEVRVNGDELFEGLPDVIADE